ncbi:hypothetical protein HA461_07895 [Rhizobium leguminosarum bv. trifolii]|nr:hypothetical protein [Rhizobium leguminosarum]QIO51103.1 hypothetical protein HA461_07895 [Rhizobium leguminosarum bv. trifolii]
MQIETSSGKGGIDRQPGGFAGEAESGAHHVGVDAAVGVKRPEFRPG